ncbi:hypothetical protein AYO20_03999 [Fonsecaea nubica]|uniref:Uncharacterized protein n=1 Tax=Fonsecaea nubica TaxID=856822 RepID=A0A178D4N9_9EURO|nr:hypothetical protein AYO20_03999 [Fonsecaea nubica]OAL36667.1 hypothetical protein AYO20_03999 [Fonsecaea nubica]
MQRSTRRSAARNALEWDADDVTAILNEEAAHSMQSSPRKQKSESRGASDALTASTKRSRIEQPVPSASDVVMATTASPSRRRSGRLQARKSLSAPTFLNRRDLFEIPDDAETNSREMALLGPLKKLRALNQRPQDTASPFKGKGVLETRTNALVNLDDSPRKRPVRRRIERIGRSLHKPQRASKLKETTAITDREPFDGEDLFEASRREGQDQAPPEQELELSEEAPTNEVVQNRPSKESHRPKIQQPAHQPVESGTDAGLEIGQNQPPGAGPLNPLVEIAKQALAEAIPEPHILVEAIEEGRRDTTDNADQGQESAKPTTQQSRRPRTQADRDAAEQTVAEAEAKRERLVKAALSGIEIAVRVHDCMDAWTESLVAAAEVVESRSCSEPESTEGKACAREFTKLASIYKAIRRGHPGSPQGLEREKRETLRLLRRRCKHICDYHYRPDMRFDPKRKRMVRDLYEHLIPTSLDLAKRALRTLFQNDGLSVTALRELCQLLNITSKLVRSAQAWTPRPVLENAVKSKTHSNIKVHVGNIVKNYLRAVDEDERERFVDELACQQKENLEKQQAEDRRRREAALAKHRQYHYSYVGVASPNEPVPSSQCQLIDIDDISIGEEYVLPASSRRQDTGSLNGTAVRVRPRIRREPTEEIPPPDETEWNECELIVLVNALQEYTGESRWEDIIDAYGGPGGSLEKYDMDQLMAKARWVKQTMARQLEHELDESWDWLRSVPG